MNSFDYVLIKPIFILVSSTQKAWKFVYLPRSLHNRQEICWTENCNIKRM